MSCPEVERAITAASSCSLCFGAASHCLQPPVSVTAVLTDHHGSNVRSPLILFTALQYGDSLTGWNPWPSPEDRGPFGGRGQAILDDHRLPPFIRQAVLRRLVKLVAREDRADVYGLVPTVIDRNYAKVHVADASLQ